jgi:hypothetical protein
MLVACTSLGLLPALDPPAGAATTAGATPGAAAATAPAAAGGTALELAGQSAWVTPTAPGFSLSVVTHRGRQSGSLALYVTVYQRLVTRTGFAQALAGTPSGTVIDQLGPIADPGSPTAQTVDLQVGTRSVPLGSSTTALGLDCSGATPCSGVYPVVVALRARAGGPVLSRLDTFLTYVEQPSADPLRFALVLPVATPVQVRRTTDPTAALSSPSTAAATRLAGAVRAVAGQPDVPTTLLVDPHTVQRLAGGSAADHQTVAGLASLSSTADVEIPSAPFVPVDLGALAGAGLTGEITYQMEVGSAALVRSGIHTDPVATSPWVSPGAPSGALAAGMADAGVAHVVIPESALDTSADRYGVTQPFALTAGRGPAVSAAAADTGLDAHFDRVGSDPVLAAQQLLADLAFIEYESPYDAAPRGVVAVAPTRAVDGRFVAAVLAGLSQNPNVSAVTLDQFFTQVPAGTNGAPAARTVTGTGGAAMSVPLADRVSMARQRNDAFDSAVRGAPPVLTSLDDLLLASESDDLGASGGLRAVGIYEAALGAQLAQVQLSTVRTITLTSRTGSIPVTFLSSAQYSLVGDVQLTSDKFTFPNGSTLDAYRIDRATNTAAVAVVARTSGDLPLRIALVAPHADPGAPPLVIAHGEITIRSTATSVVGIVLTLVAAAVLLAWWVRTWRRGRRQGGRGRTPGPRGVPSGLAE